MDSIFWHAHHKAIVKPLISEGVGYVTPGGRLTNHQTNHAEVSLLAIKLDDGRWCRSQRQDTLSRTCVFDEEKRAVCVVSNKYMYRQMMGFL